MYTSTVTGICSVASTSVNDVPCFGSSKAYWPWHTTINAQTVSPIKYILYLNSRLHVSRFSVELSASNLSGKYPETGTRMTWKRPSTGFLFQPCTSGWNWGTYCGEPSFLMSCPHTCDLRRWQASEYRQFFLSVKHTFLVDLLRPKFHGHFCLFIFVYIFHSCSFTVQISIFHRDFNLYSSLRLLYIRQRTWFVMFIVWHIHW